MLVNRGKLRDKMIVKNKTSKQVAQYLGITEQSFCAKMRYRQEFKEHEIVKLTTLFSKDILF